MTPREAAALLSLGQLSGLEPDPSIAANLKGAAEVYARVLSLAGIDYPTAEAAMLAIVSESGGKLPAVFGNAVQGSIEAGGRIGTAAIKGIQDASKGAGEAVGGLLQGIGDAFGGKGKGKGK